MRRLLLAALLVSAGTSTLAGQSAPAVTLGARVRAYIPAVYQSREVLSASRYHVGTVESMDSLSLTIREQDGTEFRIPFSGLRELKLSAGTVGAGEARRRGITRGALIGAGMGAGGVLLATAVVQIGNRVSSDPLCVPGRFGCGEKQPEEGAFSAGRAPVLAAIAAAGGGALGALLGAVAGPAGHERWIGVPVRSLRLQAAPTASGGAAIALRF
jgi:hypothetical protein